MGEQSTSTDDRERGPVAWKTGDDERGPVARRPIADRRGRVADDERGQTALDLVAGVSVFLLVMGFAVGFVPQMYAPFDDDPQRPIVADRAVDGVVDRLVTDPGAPSVANESCALAFLRGSGDACGFDASRDLNEQLGVGPRYRTNVSLRRDQTGDAGLEVLCGEDAAVQPCSRGGTPLAVGPDVPDDRSSVDSARRIVFVDGRDATVVVYVW